jgi:hypothetical protein
MSRPPQPPPRTTAALAVLRDADHLLDGWRCEASTECCRFGVTGREPHLTEVEWQIVVEEIARQGRRMPAAPEDGTCAFLKGGRCSIYAARPLGCRTFYCDRADGPGRYPRADLARMPRALEALSTPDAAGDRRGRPLRAWLGAARRRR